MLQVVAYQAPPAYEPYRLAFLLYRCVPPAMAMPARHCCRHRAPCAPPLLPRFRLTAALHCRCRQPGDTPLDIALRRHSLHKFDEAASPTDSAGPAERRGFEAKQLAARYHLGRPVAVHWLECVPAAVAAG